MLFIEVDLEEPERPTDDNGERTTVHDHRAPMEHTGSLRFTFEELDDSAK